jgi:hypothetical protein
VTPSNIPIALPLLFTTMPYLALLAARNRVLDFREKAIKARGAVSHRHLAWPACATVSLTCHAAHAAHAAMPVEHAIDSDARKCGSNFLAVSGSAPRIVKVGNEAWA